MTSVAEHKAKTAYTVKTDEGEFTFHSGRTGLLQADYKTIHGVQMTGVLCYEGGHWQGEPWERIEFGVSETTREQIKEAADQWLADHAEAYK